MPIFDQYDRAVPPYDLSVDHLLKSHPHGVVLAVLLVPGASKTEVVGVHGDALRVRIGAPPEGERANKDLLNILRVFFWLQGRAALGRPCPTQPRAATRRCQR